MPPTTIVRCVVLKRHDPLMAELRRMIEQAGWPIEKMYYCHEDGAIKNARAVKKEKKARETSRDARLW